MRIGESTATATAPRIDFPADVATGFEEIFEDARRAQSAEAPVGARAARAAMVAVMRQEILSKGLFAYVQERQMEKLRAEIREDVMRTLGVSEHTLSAMPDEQRAALENRIEEEVERRLKERVMLQIEEELAEQIRAGREREDSGALGASGPSST